MVMRCGDARAATKPPTLLKDEGWRLRFSFLGRVEVRYVFALPDEFTDQNWGRR